MVISVSVVKNPRKKWHCAQCRVWSQEAYVRMFGHADTGDKPYALLFCMKCAKAYEHPKVSAALEQSRRKVPCRRRSRRTPRARVVSS